MKNKIELILSLTIIAVVSIYGAYIFAIFGFKFGPHQMTYPAMIIAFLISSSLNIAKLKDKNASRIIYKVSVFSNVLTLCLATTFVIHDPSAVHKIITTLIMGIITVLSILSLRSPGKQNSAFAH